MTLRRTVEHRLGVFRIFEVAPDVFHVLDRDGRTVDEFDIIETAGAAGGISVKQAFRHKPCNPTVPDLAHSFASELNAARLSH